MGCGKAMAAMEEKEEREEKKRARLVKRGDKIKLRKSYGLAVVIEIVEEKINRMIDADLPRTQQEHQDLKYIVDLLWGIDKA